MKITIGIRTAKVSLVQGKSVAALLHAAGVEAELAPIRTIGDSLEVGLAGQQGADIFTKEIDEALSRGEVDVAVHDMSHLAPTLPKGISIVAVPARFDPREAFVSNRARKMGELKQGARVGVSGVSRGPQLTHMGKGFEVVPIVHDIEANLRALSEGTVDALLLSSAELERLGIENVICERLPVDKIVPAIGQGALAIQARSDRKELMKLVSKACHNNASGIARKAERAFFKAAAGSGAVFAANAEITPKGLHLAAFVSTPDASRFHFDRIDGKVDEPAELGKNFAERLLEKFGG